jgi:hypothetical protein
LPAIGVVRGQVPYEYLGLARDIRRRIDKDALAWGDRADALLEPLKTKERRSRVALVRLFHAWRKLPAAGRLGPLTITLDTTGLRIEEIRLYAGQIALSRRSWQDHEDVIDIRRVRLGLTSTGYVSDVLLLASVGLHALARRVQRGSLPGLTSILSDLQTLAESYHRILQGPNAFRIEAPSGGAWIGVVMRSPDDRPQLTVRTFLGVNDA